MRARGPLAQVWSDLADLFSHEDRRFWFLFVAAILLQAGFWYLAAPGPRLLALEVRLPENAVRGVLWTATLLLVIPFLLGTLLRFQPAETRLNAGKARFGIVVVLAVWAVSLPLLFFSADDRAIPARVPMARILGRINNHHAHTLVGDLSALLCRFRILFSEAFCCSWSPGNGVRLPGSGFRPPLPPSSRWAGRSRRCWLLYRSAFFSVSWSSEAARCSTRSCSTGCSASVPTYFRFTTRNFSSPEPPGLGTGTYSRAHRVARFLGENHWTKITGSGIGRSRSNWYHRQFRVNVELDDSPTHL